MYATRVGWGGASGGCTCTDSRGVLIPMAKAALKPSAPPPFATHRRAWSLSEHVGQVTGRKVCSWWKHCWQERWFLGKQRMRQDRKLARVWKYVRGQGAKTVVFRSRQKASDMHEERRS